MAVLRDPKYPPDLTLGAIEQFAVFAARDMQVHQSDWFSRTALVRMGIMYADLYSLASPQVIRDLIALLAAVKYAERDGLDLPPIVRDQARRLSKWAEALPVSPAFTAFRRTTDDSEKEKAT